MVRKLNILVFILLVNVFYESKSLKPKSLYLHDENLRVSFFFSQIKKINRFTDVRKCEIDLC